MFIKNPDFIAHLQIFGEMDIVLTHKQIGLWKQQQGSKCSY